MIVQRIYSFIPNCEEDGQKEGRGRCLHVECSGFSPVSQSRADTAPARATVSYGMTWRTAAVRDTLRASSSALVASASLA